MAKKTILCIDDDVETLQLIKLILSRRDFDIISTTSGQAGLELAQRHLPDLILLDVMMPEVDGWQVLEKLRANETTKDLRVVLFSAVRMITPSKVDGYIFKPFSPDQLVEGVRRALED